MVARWDASLVGWVVEGLIDQFIDGGWSMDKEEAQRVVSHIHGDMLFRSPMAPPVGWDRA